MFYYLMQHISCFDCMLFQIYFTFASLMMGSLTHRYPDLHDKPVHKFLISVFLLCSSVLYSAGIKYRQYSVRFTCHLLLMWRLYYFFMLCSFYKNNNKKLHITLCRYVCGKYSACQIVQSTITSNTGLCIQSSQCICSFLIA